MLTFGNHCLHIAFSRSDAMSVGFALQNSPAGRLTLRVFLVYVFGLLFCYRDYQISQAGFMPEAVVGGLLESSAACLLCQLVVKCVLRFLSSVWLSSQLLQPHSP